MVVASSWSKPCLTSFSVRVRSRLAGKQVPSLSQASLEEPFESGRESRTPPHPTMRSEALPFCRAHSYSVAQRCPFFCSFDGPGFLLKLVGTKKGTLVGMALLGCLE